MISIATSKSNATGAKCRSFGFVVAALALMLNLPCNAAPGGRKLIDFEDHQLGSQLYNQYSGVSFTDASYKGPDAPYTGPPDAYVIEQPAAGTVSGTHALRGGYFGLCTGQEFPNNCRYFQMNFEEPQGDVAFSIAGVKGSAVATRIDAWSKSGASVTSFVSKDTCGDKSGRVQNSIRVLDPNNSITTIRIRRVNCQNGTYLDTPYAEPFWIDNLVYTLPLHPKPHEHNPPIISVIKPAEHSLVKSGFYGPHVSPTVKILEHNLKLLSVAVNGGPPLPMNWGPDSAANDTYNGNVDIFQNGLNEGENTLIFAATDWDDPPNTVETTVHFFLDKKPKPPSSASIHLSGFEVTQSIDNGPVPVNPDMPSISSDPIDGYDVDYHPSIPLLQGKDILIRVYGASSGTSMVTNGVPARMDVWRDNCAGDNCYIALSLPVSTSRFQADTSGLSVYPLGSPEADLVNIANTFSPTWFTKSWNFFIPKEWENYGDLRVDIEVNPADDENSVPECTSDNDRECQHDHRLRLHLHFEPTPTLPVAEVTLIATGNYTCNGNTITFGPVPTGGDGDGSIVATWAQDGRIWSVLQEIFPQNMEPTGYASYLPVYINTDSAQDVLNRIQDIAYNDNLLTLGIVPVNPNAYSPGCGLYSPNEPQPDGSHISGLAVNGGNAAWADADDPIDAAHELMHNIGFDHWACEFGVEPGGPKGVEADECSHYPIPHGGTGVYGTDIDGWIIYPPGDTSGALTPHSHDLMTYGNLCSLPSYGGLPGCNYGKWISAFDWQILRGSNGPETYDTDDPQVLLARGQILPDGTADLKPIVPTMSNTAPKDYISDDQEEIYTFEGRDSRGNVLLAHNFEPHKLDVHRGGYGRHLVFRERLPYVSGLWRLDLVHAGKALTSIQRPRISPARRVVVTSPKTGEVWQMGKPAVIAWKVDQGATAPPDKLDVVVQYSADGKNRVGLAGRRVGDTLVVDPVMIAGSSSAKVFVAVSDGLNFTQGESGPFKVQAKAPKAVITEPPDNQKISAMIAVPLRGYALDLQDKISPDHMVWAIDGRIIATGVNSTVVQGLSPGIHNVTLAVGNTAGLTSTARHRFEVLNDAPKKKTQHP